MVFSDGTAWMFRLPRVEMVCDDYADEKVAKEVKALSSFHQRTTIPVPTAHAWGLAASNFLCLGPFIAIALRTVSPGLPGISNLLHLQIDGLRSDKVRSSFSIIVASNHE
jgi:hypothetical protein